MQSKYYPDKIFENVALSLSGGGYKAAGFHLGTLSYLNHIEIENKPFLQNVKILSTISGGAITGLMYAHSIAKGLSFKEFYQDLYQKLEQDQLFKLALGKLEETKGWKNKRKTQNLINAFAEVYNEMFFANESFAIFWEHSTHLEDLIFNATSFYRGKHFRFQKTKKDDGKIGNYFMEVPVEIACEFKLGDILAASSCFPGGFEPIQMPDDFAQAENSPLMAFWKEKNWDSIALMDGGIIDNQGIESIELAEKRRLDQRDGKFLDLYIISDVGDKFMEPFVFPEKIMTNKWNWLQLRILNSFILFALIGSAIIIFLTAFDFIGNLPFLGTVLTSITLTITVIYWMIYTSIKRIVLALFKKNFGVKANSLLQKGKFIQYTPLFHLYDQLILRKNTIVKIVSDIFMKQIKSKQYGLLYQSDKWKYRIFSNSIYSILDFELEGQQGVILKPSDEMIDLAKKVNRMETTLWFSEDHENEKMLDALILTGQFTVCAKLIKHLSKLRTEKVFDTLNKKNQELFAKLEKDLILDFEKYQKNEKWLISLWNY